MGSDATTRPWWRPRWVIATVLIFCSILPGLYYLHTYSLGLGFKAGRPGQQDAYGGFDPDTSNSNEPDTIPPLNFHFLATTAYSSENLCKLMISAGVLGFPSPVILNTTQAQGSPARTRIAAAFRALAQLPEAHDNDLAVVTNNLGFWTQLRPQALIDRFFDINRRANEVLRGRYGHTAGKQAIRQEVLFSGETECLPFSWDESPCYAAPVPEQPNNAAGDLPSTQLRYLSSDLIVGHVKALKAIFQEALRLLDEPDPSDDRDILAQMYGEQELYRQVVRHDPNNFDEIVSGLHPSFAPSEKMLQHVGQMGDRAKSQKFDFGIGVDHKGALLAPGDSPSNIMKLVTFKRKSENAEPGRGPMSLPSDIAQSIPPFWTFTPENLPRRLGWDEVPLLTNTHTSTIPVFVRSTATLDSQNSETWPKAWFADSVRTLYDTHVYSPLVPLAYNQRAWWGFEPWRGGGRDGSPDFDAPWLRTDHLCEAFHERVFADGRGPWVLPENH